MNKKRILLVDDEPSATRLLQMMLEHSGHYNVRSVNASSQVISVAEEFLPDFILLDVIMPDQDGGDVAETLKGHPKLSRIPVGFLTASVGSIAEGTQECTFGGYPFLAKPASTAAIMAFIEKHSGG